MTIEHVRTLNCILYGLLAVIGSCVALLGLLLWLAQPSDDVGDNA